MDFAMLDHGKLEQHFGHLELFRHCFLAGFFYELYCNNICFKLFMGRRKN
jgi:hypothetical protein